MPEEGWKTAGEISDLFEPSGIVPGDQAERSELSTAADGRHRAFQRRSFTGIIAESFRLYGRGFPSFFALSLLIALPSLGFQLSWACIHFSEGELVTTTTRVASAVAVVMVAAILVSWPIFVGGLQFAVADLTAGRRIQLRDVLRRAVNHWPRVARLSLVVYGSYIFWTLLPLLAVLAVASVPSVWSILFALLALAGQVFMVGRLFINFMFWQQASTLGGLEGTEALQESRELARSRVQAPALERPLWRGVLLASLWLVVLILVSIAIELPFLLVRLQGITNFDDAYAMMKRLSEATVPDAMTIATYVLSSLVHAALRPLLGIAFVVLYFDAKDRP